MKSIRDAVGSFGSAMKILGILFIVAAAREGFAATLSLTSSASYQQAINVTYSNPTVVGNTLQVTIQIQNTSGTWVYIQQDTTSTPNIPVSLPYTVYLLGPGATKSFNNVAFTVNSYLKFNITTPIGLDFTTLATDPKPRALFGAMIVDCMTRGLLTFALPANAFDETFNSATGVVDPLLDNIVSTLQQDGSNIGSAAVDLKKRDWVKLSVDFGQIASQIASESSSLQNSIRQLLQRANIGLSSGQTGTFFNNASTWLGVIAEVLDLPAKYTLLHDISISTFGAPPTSWNRFDVVVTAQAPSVSYVSPSAFTGLPIGQTKLIRVIGSGFTGSSTLTFNDGVTSYPGRVPTFVSGNELDYNITTGTNQANWKVQVVNGAQTSGYGYFTVNAPSAPPQQYGSLVVNLSPAGAISAGAQWQVDGTDYNGSGQVVGYLTLGSHTVSFKPISGYTTPANQIVTINANAQTTATGTYSVVAPSTYTLTLNSDGVTGYIVNQPFGTGSGNIYNAGAVVQLTANAYFGYHFVSWGGDASSSGTQNPTTIVMNGNKTVSANFAAGDPNLGTVTVTIQPPEAVTAGVTWGFNDTDFHASGSSYSYYPETVWVELHATNGWTGVGGWVTFTAGVTTNYTFTASTTNGSIIGSDPRTYYTLAGSAGNSGSTDGTNSSALFSFPKSLAVDSVGNIFVSDNALIRKISPAGVVTTVAGPIGNNNQGIAVDNSGNLYVADMMDSVILKITTNGIVSTFAGQAGSNGSVDATGSAARFYFPIGIAVDTNGNVYVADSVNETIRKITPEAVVTTLAGSPRNYGYADGTGSAALFRNPCGLCVDGSGNIYVADNANQVVRKVTQAGVVTTVAGYPGSSGAADGTGNAARFYSPNGIAVDSAGNVYVADTSNQAIRKITPSGVVTTLAGQSGNPGSADGIGSVARFDQPSGVAVDSSGNLFITDLVNDTIRATQPLTNKVDQFISFAPLPNKSAGDAPFSISATSSSGLPVYLNVLSGPAVLDTNNTLTLLGGGMVNVIAWQPGNSNYNAATSVLQSFSVRKIPQSISFGVLSQQKVGDAPFSLSATSDSGLPVSFSVSGPAMLDGNILTLTSWGTVTVTASQAGDSSYMAATNIVQSFFVVPSDNTIIAPKKLPNGDFQLAFYGLTGSNYLIETSTNLRDWQQFTSFVGTNSLRYFNDPDAANFKLRFYRVMKQ